MVAAQRSSPFSSLPPPPLNVRLLSKRSVCSSHLSVPSASLNSRTGPGRWPPSLPPCPSCRAQQSCSVITALWSLSRTFFSPDATPVGLDSGGRANPSPWHLPRRPRNHFPERGSPDGMRSSGKSCGLRSALILSGLNICVD